MTARPDLAPAISQVMLDHHARGEFEGVVLVARGEALLFHGACGLAERRWDIPNAPDTRFRIASITKQFTALLVMQEVEAGRLDLDAPLVTALPWYRPDLAGVLTARQLLTHTSGLPELPESYYRLPLDMSNIRAVVEAHCSGDLKEPPGGRFLYNNADYLVIQALLEAVSGRRYAELLQERVFRPLGMADSGLLRAGSIVARLASGYERGPDSALQAEEPQRPENYGAAGALYASATDLWRWNRALQQDRLLDRAARERMWTADPALGFVALGSWVYDWAGLRLVDRQGAMGGFHLLNLQAPEAGLSLIFLNNAASLDLYQTYSRTGIAHALLGLLTAKA